MEPRYRQDTVTIEKELKKKALKKRKKPLKISKLDFLVNLYNGKPGRKGDPSPIEPVTDVDILAEKLMKAENKGYFRVRTVSISERNDYKYKSEVRWYLTQAAKKGLINKKYTPRK